VNLPHDENAMVGSNTYRDENNDAFSYAERDVSPVIYGIV
jgi:hypothetical protein